MIARHLVDDLLADGLVTQAKLVAIAHIVDNVEVYAKLQVAEHLLVREANYRTATRLADATMTEYHMPVGVNWTSIQEQVSGIITNGLGGTRYPSVTQLNEIVKSISDMFKNMCGVDPATNQVQVADKPMGFSGPNSGKGDVQGIGPGFEGGAFPVIKAPQSTDESSDEDPPTRSNDPNKIYRGV